MKRFKFNICMAVVLITSLSLYTQKCDNYNPEEYSSEKPVDFVYINKSDYTINALLLDHKTDAIDTLLDNKTTINLEPGDSVTMVTDNPVDGNYAIFKEYIVIFNDTEFFSYFARQRQNPYGRWDPEIPLYPISYKIRSGENERNHTVYEFTFTNSHYEAVRSKSWAHEEICTTEKGERYFKGWEYYGGPQNRGMGVTVDSLVWSPCDYNSTMYLRRGFYSYYKYEDALNICPKGWRTPTAEEFASLMANHSQWGETRGKSASDSDANETADGYWFSGSNKYSLDVPAVFFPGHYLWSDNDLKVGIYWTATKDSDGLAQAFRFDSSGDIALVSKDESDTYLLRCVKDYNHRKYYFGD